MISLITDFSFFTLYFSSVLIAINVYDCAKNSKIILFLFQMLLIMSLLYLWPVLYIIQLQRGRNLSFGVLSSLCLLLLCLVFAGQWPRSFFRWDQMLISVLVFEHVLLLLLFSILMLHVLTIIFVVLDLCSSIDLCWSLNWNEERSIW